ncbi:hypothetical protein [Kocuria varians]|uniref:hypothetical protein n=1 Tax=Kocuria varians TaxID=1272 RepID=UPI000B97BC35|nr:hypothetical protein [Kocuria varians]
MALLALAAAAWAARTSKQLYETEQRRDRIAQSERDKAQAAHIAAWCITYSTPQGTPSPRGLLIHNSSSAPVFNVVVESTYAKKKRDEPEAQKNFTMRILTPGDYVTMAEPTFGWTFPEEKISFEEDNNVRFRPVTNNEGWQVTSLRFADSSGMAWVRDATGQLSPTSP